LKCSERSIAFLAGARRIIGRYFSDPHRAQGDQVNNGFCSKVTCLGQFAQIRELIGNF